MKNSFADILREIEGDGRGRLAAKVPQWSAVEGLELPTRLCTEQCSSSETAIYKAEIISAISGRKPRVADLTGGLGVDSWAFSQVAEKVLHNEMDPALSRAVQGNFARLGITNAEFSNIEVRKDNIGEILDSFHPDAVFMDPARRSSTGGKVFRIADCTPNVLELVPEIFSRCGTLLLKLSPMADLTQVVRELEGAGASVSGAHILGAGGECKELLILMRKGESQGYSITVSTPGASLTFRPEEESAATAAIATPDDIQGFLFEPGKALSKSGAFKLIAERFGIRPLGVSTHLYVSPTPVESLDKLGKWFRIVSKSPLDKRTMKETGKAHPAASVSARNIPIGSDELRKRMGVVREGDTHIFGVKSDSAGNLLLVCLPEKLS